MIHVDTQQRDSQQQLRLINPFLFANPTDPHSNHVEIIALCRCSIEQFVQRIKRNSTLTELTPYALRELVKAVYVDAPDKSGGKRRQKVHIEYDLVGFIPVDELLKAEQA